MIAYVVTIMDGTGRVEEVPVKADDPLTATFIVGAVGGASDLLWARKVQVVSARPISEEDWFRYHADKPKSNGATAESV